MILFPMCSTPVLHDIQSPKPLISLGFRMGWKIKIICVLSISFPQNPRYAFGPFYSCFKTRWCYYGRTKGVGSAIMDLVGSIVGHAFMDMTQHYLHVQEPIRRDAIARFSAAFGGSNTQLGISTNCKIVPPSLGLETPDHGRFSQTGLPPIFCQAP